MSFGKNLKECIKLKNITLSEAAGLINLTDQALYATVQNRSIPKTENLISLCDRLTIPINDLFVNVINFDNTEEQSFREINRMLTVSNHKDTINGLIDAMIEGLKHDELNSFGQKIRQIKYKKGLTAPCLSKLTGISPQTIRNIENDAYMPSLERIVVIANALNVSPGYMLSDYTSTDSIERFHLLYPYDITAIETTIRYIYQNKIL